MAAIPAVYTQPHPTSIPRIQVYAPGTKPGFWYWNVYDDQDRPTGRSERHLHSRTCFAAARQAGRELGLPVLPPGGPEAHFYALNEHWTRKLYAIAGGLSLRAERAWRIVDDSHVWMYDGMLAAIVDDGHETHTCTDTRPLSMMNGGETRFSCTCDVMAGLRYPCAHIMSLNIRRKVAVAMRELHGIWHPLLGERDETPLDAIPF